MSIFVLSNGDLDYNFFGKFSDNEFNVLLDYNYKYKLKSYQKIKCKLIGYYFNEEIKVMQKAGLYSNIVGTENVVNCIFNSFIDMIEFGYYCDKNVYYHNITEFMYRYKIPREFEILIHSILVEYLEMSVKIFTSVNNIGECHNTNIYTDLCNLLTDIILKIYPNIVNECEVYFDNEIDKTIVELCKDKNKYISLTNSENTEIWGIVVFNYLLYRLADYCTNTINILLMNNKNNVFDEFDNIINKYKEINSNFFKNVFLYIPSNIIGEIDNSFKVSIFNHNDTNINFLLKNEDYITEYKDNIKHRIGTKIFIIDCPTRYGVFYDLLIFIFKKINELYGGNK